MKITQLVAGEDGLQIQKEAVSVLYKQQHTADKERFSIFGVGRGVNLSSSKQTLVRFVTEGPMAGFCEHLILCLCIRIFLPLRALNYCFLEVTFA